MNISISLTPELVGMIKAKVEGGRYSSTSEVVREALRLLERMDGALALVSGRPIRDIDKLFSPLKLPTVSVWDLAPPVPESPGAAQSFPCYGHDSAQVFAGG